VTGGLRTTIGGVSWDGGARRRLAPTMEQPEPEPQPEQRPDLLPHLQAELRAARLRAAHEVYRCEALAVLVDLTADIEAAIGRRVELSDVLSGDETQQAYRRSLVLRATKEEWE
jgi:hypothetical protein